MNTKISTAVKDKLRNSPIAKKLPVQAVQLENTLSTAVDSVVTEFTSVANDTDGRQRLYNAVNLKDAVVSPHEAKVQLNTIVGDAGYKRLVKQVRVGNDLNDVQTGDLLSVVSPSVLDALGSELNDGTVENSPSGLMSLLNSSGTVTHVTKKVSSTVGGTGNTHKGAQATARTSHQSVHASGVATAEAGNSGWIRYALPLLLIGALVVGSIKYCGDSAKSRVIAEERGVLEQELAGAQEQSEIQVNKIASLQGDYDSAQSQIGQLEGDLQTSRAEVTALRDVPTDTAELQQSLASVTGERDVAIESGSVLQEQLEQLTTEHNQALQQGQSLQTELDGARATITDNEESIANVDRLQAEITEITVARDDTLERNVELTAANDKLQVEVEEIEPTITGLESQVETLTSERTDLDQQLLERTEAYEKEIADRKADVDLLTQQVEEQKALVAESAPTIENLEGEVASLTDEKTQLETKLISTTQDLEEARTARQQDTQRLTAETTDLTGQLSAMLNFRNTAEASLEKQEAKVIEQTETITGLEEQVALTGEELKQAQSEFDELDKERSSLIDARDKLTGNIDDLNVEKIAAQEEIERLNTDIAKLTGDLETAEVDGKANEAKIGELESSLKTEQATVTELEESNTSLEQEKQSLLVEYDSANGIIEALEAQLKKQGQKLQQEQETIATLNTSVATLEADGAALSEARDNAESQTGVLEELLAVTDRNVETLTADRDSLQGDIDDAEANAQALIDETLTVRDEVEQQLIDAGVTDAVVKSIDDDQAVAITLGSGNLFQTGQASLTREGGVILAKIGNILTDYSSDWRLDVEGHTDSLGIGKALRQRYPTNWELSSARAAAAVRHMNNVGGVDAESLSVTGFADTKPIGDNSTAGGREQNRRVDIILRR